MFQYIPQATQEASCPPPIQVPISTWQEGCNALALALLPSVGVMGPWRGEINFLFLARASHFHFALDPPNYYYYYFFLMSETFILTYFHTNTNIRFLEILCNV